jgi:two-component system cell cycle response regulator
MMMQNMILVVDDELDTIELIQAAFKRSECIVCGAMNGHEGLQLARERRPAVIMIDLMLPGLDGFELCRRLRDDPMTARIPRVILSACDSSADQADALAAGADRYVVKPVRMKALINLVEGLIGQTCSAAV